MKRHLKSFLQSHLSCLQRRIRADKGHMLTKRLRVHEDQGEQFFFENGVPLFSGKTSHASIRKTGKGLCDHSDHYLLFARHKSRFWLPFWPVIQNCPQNASLPPYLLDYAFSPCNKADMADLLRKNILTDLLRKRILLDNSIDDSSQEQKTPHLILVNHSLSPGGAERQWCYLASEIARRGYKVSLLTCSLAGESGHYISLLSGQPVDVYELDTYTPFSTMRSEMLNDATSPRISPRISQLAMLFKTLRPSHVLCQLDHTNIWGSAAAILARCGVQKILLSFRSLNPSHYPHIFTPWMPDCYRELIKSKLVLLTGNSLAGNNDYADWLGISRDNIALIPNALPPESMTVTIPGKTLRLQLGISENAIVILGVLRLTEEKNPLLFFAVAQKLCLQHKDVAVLHAGAGPYAEILREMTAKAGLADRIHFLGTRKDIPDLMAASDILLLCSRQEGTSNVLLEAQYLQLPIVATAVGGTPSAVREGESALLGPSGDADALAAHCLTLCRDPELRSRMGRAGREHVLREFSKQQLADRTLEVLGLEPTPAASFARQTPGKV